KWDNVIFIFPNLAKNDSSSTMDRYCMGSSAWMDIHNRFNNLFTTPGYEMYSHYRCRRL
ncbi:hypothetical protein L9F63_026295, partial [Diploptera punctata]